MEIHGKTISYAAYKKKQKNSKGKRLQEEIKTLEEAYDPDLSVLDKKKKMSYKQYFRKASRYNGMGKIKVVRKKEKNLQSIFCALL